MDCGGARFEHLCIQCQLVCGSSLHSGRVGPGAGSNSSTCQFLPYHAPLTGNDNILPNSKTPPSEPWCVSSGLRKWGARPNKSERKKFRNFNLENEIRGRFRGKTSWFLGAWPMAPNLQSSNIQSSSPKANPTGQGDLLPKHKLSLPFIMKG